MRYPENCGCHLYHWWPEDENPEEPQEIWADDPENAAERAVQSWLEEDYDSAPMKVFIKAPDATEATAFIVESQVEISYYARLA